MPYKNPDHWNEYNRRRYSDNKAEFAGLKESLPCTDCQGYFPHYIMEYDHARGDKKYNVATIVGSRGIGAPSVIAEMAKCDLVCANCHKTRTFSRQV